MWEELSEEDLKTEQIFIWRNVEPVSDYYHSNGGLVVIAKSLEEARGLAMEKLNRVEGAATAVWLTEDPDIILPLLTGMIKDEDRVLVFPDAGCC